MHDFCDYLLRILNCDNKRAEILKFLFLSYQLFIYFSVARTVYKNQRVRMAIAEIRAVSTTDLIHT